MSQGGAPGRTRGRGGEAEGGDPPGRRGSHSLLPETPPHSAAHPPSRGWLLQGCSSRARQRVAVSSHSARRATPPPPARRSRDHGSRQPSAARESAVAAAGKGCGPTAQRCALDDAAPARRPLPAPGAGKGGWEAGRRVRSEGPGGKGSQGAEQKPKAEAAAGGAAREIQSRQRGGPARPPPARPADPAART